MLRGQFYFPSYTWSFVTRCRWQLLQNSPKYVRENGIAPKINFVGICVRICPFRLVAWVGLCEMELLWKLCYNSEVEGNKVFFEGELRVNVETSSTLLSVCCKLQYAIVTSSNLLLFAVTCCKLQNFVVTCSIMQ